MVYKPRAFNNVFHKAVKPCKHQEFGEVYRLMPKPQSKRAKRGIFVVLQTKEIVF
jgi:hypothetical protein